MKSKLLSLMLCFGLCSMSYADEFEEFDELSDIIKSISDDDVRALRSCEPGEASDWLGYLDLLEIPKLFNEDFYNVTSLPNYRNVINYPNFFIFSYQAPQEQQLTFHLFYNQTSKRHYTQDVEYECSRSKKHEVDGRILGSYLNIENGTILSVLESDLKNFGGLLPSSLAPLRGIDFPKIFTTLSQAALQERRIGFLTHYYKQITPKVSLELKMPILWQVRNLNFTEAEKRTLRQEFSAFQGDDFDEMKFGQEHLIMDALGTGTLDITVKYQVKETDKYDLQVGATIYAPTDGHWTQGLYGTYFEPKDQQPILRLCDLVRISATPPRLEKNATEIVEKFFLGALDHLSSAILQCPLGYDKHLGVALKILPFWQFRENILYSGVYILEYLFSREQERFFIPTTETPFSEQFANFTGTDEAKLDFLERKITERLYPRVFTTNVKPGFLFNTVANVQTSYKDWNFTVGYNYWYKSGEKLSDIQTTQAEIDTLNICKATNTSASQVKIYGKIHRLFETSRHHHNVSFSLYGNLTVYNHNIGNDFSLGCSFDKTF